MTDITVVTVVNVDAHSKQSQDGVPTQTQARCYTENEEKKFRPQKTLLKPVTSPFDICDSVLNIQTRRCGSQL